MHSVNRIEVIYLRISIRAIYINSLFHYYFCAIKKSVHALATICFNRKFLKQSTKNPEGICGPALHSISLYGFYICILHTHCNEDYRVFTKDNVCDKP